jgi:hypothetical protein
MPIAPFLNGEPFDPESRRVLRVALEMVCIALRTGDCDEGVQQAIAKKLIALVKAGERNPDILCEEALTPAPTVRSGAVFGPGEAEARLGTRDRRKRCLGGPRSPSN